MHGKQLKDRRIQKTEASLREALATLLHEKPYDEIVVKEILNRANVGRSTFYTHFRDKDALLLSGVQDLLGPSRPRAGFPDKPWENILWFGLPLLQHIEAHHDKGEGVDPGGREAIHGHLEYALVELIGDEVKTALLHAATVKGCDRSDLVARWIASTFVLLLNWWVKGDCTLSAGEAHAVVRKVVASGVAGPG